MSPFQVNLPFLFAVPLVSGVFRGIEMDCWSKMGYSVKQN